MKKCDTKVVEQNGRFVLACFECDKPAAYFVGIEAGKGRYDYMSVYCGEHAPNGSRELYNCETK